MTALTGAALRDAARRCLRESIADDRLPAEPSVAVIRHLADILATTVSETTNAPVTTTRAFAGGRRVRAHLPR
jgi:hypothetical protein